MSVVQRCFILSGKSIRDFTLKSACSRGYSVKYQIKSELKLKWVRPVKIPCTKPTKTGDLSALTIPDQNLPRPDFEHCQELQTADETIKRLFSLEFAPRAKSIQRYIQDASDAVKQHELDTNSMEVKIARWTAIIRSLQQLEVQFPRNRKLSVTLKELIDRRKKNLKNLRKADYKRFEWLIDKLNIVYKPPPPVLHCITRKESLQKVATKYCDGIRSERLFAYKHQLEAEQPKFLEEKIRTLEFIRQEQNDCGVEVTVEQAEIDEAKKKLEQLQNKMQQSA